MVLFGTSFTLEVCKAFFVALSSLKSTDKQQLMYKATRLLGSYRVPRRMSTMSLLIRLEHFLLFDICVLQLLKTLHNFSAILALELESDNSADSYPFLFSLQWSEHLIQIMTSQTSRRADNTSLERIQLRVKCDQTVAIVYLLPFLESGLLRFRWIRQRHRAVSSRSLALEKEFLKCSGVLVSIHKHAFQMSETSPLDCVSIQRRFWA